MTEPRDSQAAPTPPALTTASRGEQPVIDLEVKRSHFLGRAARADSQEEARAFIAQARAAHPDARHHCSAFILAPPGMQPVERSNDDGEPSGTAGQPMLEALRASGLVNTVVVVTRYFGGTLLGTGGLVRAYSEAACRALSAASRVRLVTRHMWDVRVPVAQAGRLEAELRATGPRGGLEVVETIWGPTHAILALSTDSADDGALAELLAAHSQGLAVPEPAGSRIIETPVDS
ncbi:YigZ family protein [Actinomyces slackii]|uniref:IMPACT family member yigZ n=1 Tax=Actinomyces slackii TaxID=52774 RepID=A0A448KCZ2_9ACTO|nr:YigZ family protein [Actinomyces slackii]VEG74795.1 IMPACT family member yigZ [Actinomyces slackii]